MFRKSTQIYIYFSSFFFNRKISKKKKRQDDFHKVKLKVGKKKPKAENSTNVNFKSRSIHLTDQLKRDVSGPTTHRQLGIKVRLHRLILSYLSWVSYLATPYGHVYNMPLYSPVFQYTVECNHSDPIIGCYYGLYVKAEHREHYTIFLNVDLDIVVHTIK